MIATMASMFPAPQVNANQVGSYFVKQYYEIIQQTPQLGYQFYTEGSTAIRIDGETEKTATSTMEIHDLLTTLNFASIEIKTLHSQGSWVGGVLVVVFGFVQMKDYNVRREFVQTFFLAPQETGYFVLNDVFHLRDEETTLQPSATILGHSNYNSSHNDYNGSSDVANDYIPDSVLSYTVEEEVQTLDYASPVNAIEEPHSREYEVPFQADEADETHTVDKYSLPEHQQVYEPEPQQVDEIHVEEPVASFPSAVTMAYEPPPVSAEEPVGERPKQTYASIVRLAKAQPDHVMPRAAPVRKSVSVSAAPTSKTTSMVSDTQNSTSQQSYSATSWSGSETVENGVVAEGDGELKSVYVKNLSASISSSDIEHEFKNFGVIKPNGVTVRSRKDLVGFYAFVEFEDVTGVQNALQASQILVKGTQIYVEARRPNSGISRVGGGSGRGRGRGGYPSEAPRGRFGGRGFSRGNGTLQRERVPRQERGILGNHSTRNGQNPVEASY